MLRECKFFCSGLLDSLAFASCAGLESSCEIGKRNKENVMRIEIEVREVYGNTLLYPMNDAAKALARIAGTKTISAANVKDACALGLEVYEVRRNYAPIANLVKAA